MCLTPLSVDGRDPRVFLDTCQPIPAQKWEVVSQSLNDFTIQSAVLELCLDVNGYAVQRTESVQVGKCEPHFDDSGRISDQYLQFEVTYSQIRISTTDAVVSAGDTAKLSCQLLNTPRVPDYVRWSNGEVSIEEFTTRAGFGISMGVFHNNSMLSVLTVDRVLRPEVWTCQFIVDRNNFSEVAEVDIPDIQCNGFSGDNSMTASMNCCYSGKYPPSKIYWQRHGYTRLETSKSYQIVAGPFENRTQCTTIHFPKSSSRLTFTVYYQTPHRTISETITSGPMVQFETDTTSPPWRAQEVTSQGYRIINDVEEQDSQQNITSNEAEAIEDSIINGSSAPCSLLTFTTIISSLSILIT